MLSNAIAKCYWEREIEGKTFFGVAGKEVRCEIVPTPMRPEQFASLQNADLIIKTAKMNEVQGLSHAEAIQLMKAFEALGRGKLGDRFAMNLDR